MPGAYTLPTRRSTHLWRIIGGYSDRRMHHHAVAIVMVALTTIVRSFFAFAKLPAAPHKDRAFQASSPKTFGLASAPALFLSGVDLGLIPPARRPQAAGRTAHRIFRKRFGRRAFPRS
ncbi:MAG TPA: hypothetical protein VF649_05380 [Sphingomonas sp.]|uniref:hypothetical protein n=1 Tax=Sphingomonas sp. TaxID=28214 RepID=UPI002ED911D3